MGGRSSSRSIEGRSGQPIGGRSVANPVEERKRLCELVARDIIVERYLGKENWKSYTYRQQDVKPWIEPKASNRRVSRATARRPVCLLSPHAESEDRRRPKKTEEDRRRPKKTEEDHHQGAWNWSGMVEGEEGDLAMVLAWAKLSKHADKCARCPCGMLLPVVVPCGLGRVVRCGLRFVWCFVGALLCKSCRKDMAHPPVIS